MVIFVKPDFNATRGSFALTALEIRAVGIGELLARLERLRRELAAEGLFSPERKRRCLSCPVSSGWCAGASPRPSATSVQNAERRWPAVRFRIEQTAVQGPYAAGRDHRGAAQARRGPRGRRDRDRQGRRLARRPAPVLRRGAAPGRGGLPDPGGVARSGTSRTPRCSTTWRTCGPRPRPTRPSGSCPTSPSSSRWSPSCGTGHAAACAAGSTASRPGWTRSGPGPALADPVREIERQAEQVDALAQRARQCLDAQPRRAERRHRAHPRAAARALPRRDAAPRLRDRAERRRQRRPVRRGGVSRRAAAASGSPKTS